MSNNIDLFGNEIIEDVLLRDRFIEPPFSVLDTRQGRWQERKKRWINLGIKSELGRGEGLVLQSEESTAENLNYYKDKKKEMRLKGNGLAEAQYRINATKEKSQKAPGCYMAIGGNSIKRLNTNKKLSTAFNIQEWAQDKQTAGAETGTSIFDPALTEVLYRWFCPPNGHILDPFAGGSVRGIVAHYLGYKYTGIELREEQVQSNNQQAENIIPANKPYYYIGDSEEVLNGLSCQFDFILSCPPYFNLEIYSDNEKDLSNMLWDSFLIKYNLIINRACQKLKSNSFACFVVSEIRDEKGIYRNFVGETIKAFQISGMDYYNELILLNVAGSLPIRAGKQFESGRKIGRTHQNILIFYKGDTKKIKDKFPPLELI